MKAETVCLCICALLNVVACKPQSIKMNIHDEQDQIRLIQVRGASVTLTPSEGQNVQGRIEFWPEGDVLQIRGNVTGLTPGKHGFHVHQYGNLSNNCLAAGGHFNPYNKKHGAPEDDERHVGDLGNIDANEDGFAGIEMEDHLIAIGTLTERNIIGLALVVHQGEDDMGKGGFDDSLTTGHAASRVACGIIKQDISVVYNRE